MNMSAFGTNSFASADISFASKPKATSRTRPRLLRIINFVKIATVRADENVFWVPNILRKQISREQIEISAAIFAVLRFYPEKAFHRHTLIAIEHTFCPIEVTDCIF
jgi:hypothetical protein